MGPKEVKAATAAAASSELPQVRSPKFKATSSSCCQDAAATARMLSSCCQDAAVAVKLLPRRSCCCHAEATAVRAAVSDLGPRQVPSRKFKAQAASYKPSHPLTSQPVKIPGKIITSQPVKIPGKIIAVQLVKMQERISQFK